MNLTAGFITFLLDGYSWILQLQMAIGFGMNNWGGFGPERMFFPNSTIRPKDGSTIFLTVKVLDSSTITKTKPGTIIDLVLRTLLPSLSPVSQPKYKGNGKQRLITEWRRVLKPTGAGVVPSLAKP